MPVYPGAKYRPLNKFSYTGGMREYLGVVLHVNDSNGPSLYNWIAGDNGMSCHWQVAKSGAVEQYVDTANASWCQTAGNRSYLSVETEGHPNEPLTAAQVAALVGIMAWAHKTHGIPLQIANHVGDRGFAWHGMGGNAWGGHPGCPGELRKAQRPAILAAAEKLVAPKPVTPAAPSNPLEIIMSLPDAPKTYAQFRADQRADVAAALVTASARNGSLWNLIETRVRVGFKRRGTGAVVGIATLLRDDK